MTIFINKRIRRKNGRKSNPFGRKARCGHFSERGRYFKCEKCLPELPSDDGDLTYFADASEEGDKTA